MKIFFFI